MQLLPGSKAQQPSRISLRLIMFRATIRTLATLYNNLTRRKTDEMNHNISRRDLAVLQMTHLRARNVAKSSLDHIFSSRWCICMNDTSEPLLTFYLKQTPQDARSTLQVPSSQLRARFVFSKDLTRHCDAKHLKRNFYCPYIGCQYAEGGSRECHRRDNMVRHIRNRHRVSEQM